MSITQTTATVQQPSAPVTPAVSNSGYGRVSYVSTVNGEKVKTAFNIVETSDLIISNHPDGRINAAYPQALQPRDRTRLSSQLQVNAIAKSLQPAQLADSALSGEGAPITGRDHIVESGNGRSMGIVKAYANGSADAYKDYLIQNAPEYGLNSALIADMARPVLIRVRLDEVDRAQFARDSNWPDTQNTIDNRVTGLFESAPAPNTGVFSQAKSIDELIRNIRSITEHHSGTLGKFAGQWLDEESGLYYNRFQYYLPETGQYISPDPIGLLGGFNPYSYVHNPANFVDPYGLETCPSAFINADVVRHASKGDWTEASSMKSKDRKDFPNGRLKSGGHGQSAINELDARGIAYNIEHTYPNGVRVGNIPSHPSKGKRTGTGQSWFPEHWSDADIKHAGKTVWDSPNNPKQDLGSGGVMVSGTYNGVFIRVVRDSKGGGSIFPDNAIQP